MDADRAFGLSWPKISRAVIDFGILLKRQWLGINRVLSWKVQTVMKFVSSLFAILAIAFHVSWIRAAEKHPNVVVIIADDLGYSDLGCYGGEIETPVLNSLAAEGLRFTQFYNTARCWPTRSSLMSGFYAQGIRRDALPGSGGGAQAARPKWAKLLPEMLKSQGYRSYHSGKWHIDGPVLAAGFDRSFETTDHDRFFSPKSSKLDDRVQPPIERGTDYYNTTAIADHAITCLVDHARDHADRPFFQYVAFLSPHFPLHGKKEDIAHYAGKYDRGWNAVRAERWKRQKEMGRVPGDLSKPEPEIGPPYHNQSAIDRLGAGEVNRPLDWEMLTPEQRTFQAKKMEVHAAMIHRMDLEIGRIIAQLRKMDQLDDTLLMFLSDNGASAEIMIRGDGHDPAAPAGSADTFLCLGPGWSNAANTPFRRHKTWVHEGGISTPLVVRWPKGFAAKNELRTTPGHVIDLVPTILAATGAKPIERVDGEAVPPLPGTNLVPAFTADANVKRESPLWWLHEGNRAIRHGDWKLTAAKNEPWQLYHLAVDRAENNDVAAKHPERAAELEKRWNEIMEEQRRLAATAGSDAKPEPKRGEGKKKGMKSS